MVTLLEPLMVLKQLEEIGVMFRLSTLLVFVLSSVFLIDLSFSLRLSGSLLEILDWGSQLACSENKCLWLK